MDMKNMLALAEQHRFNGERYVSLIHEKYNFLPKDFINQMILMGIDHMVQAADLYATVSRELQDLGKNFAVEQSHWEYCAGMQYELMYLIK